MSDNLFVNYREIFPRLKMLEYNFEKIREEYLINKDKLEYKDFTKEQQAYISEHKKGYPVTLASYFVAKTKHNNRGWHLAGVCGENFFNPTNSKYLPILVSVLNKIGNISVCGINVLDPHASLNWHNDADYSPQTPTLRTLWGLDVPIEDGKFSIFQMRDKKTGRIETRNFENGKNYSFWPETVHRVQNNMSQPRVVLAVDVCVSSTVKESNLSKMSS
jgi:hypothetical protein